MANEFNPILGLQKCRAPGAPGAPKIAASFLSTGGSAGKFGGSGGNSGGSVGKFPGWELFCGASCHRKTAFCCRKVAFCCRNAGFCCRNAGFVLKKSAFRQFSHLKNTNLETLMAADGHGWAYRILPSAAVGAYAIRPSAFIPCAAKICIICGICGKIARTRYGI